MTGALTVLDEAAIRRIISEVVRVELEAALPKAPPPAQPQDELMTLKQVAAMLAVSERDMRRLILAGIIPPGIGLGPRRLRWRRSAILDALARIEADQAKKQLNPSRSRGSVSSVKTKDGGRS